jgi:hypothetical protein
MHCALSFAIASRRALRPRPRCQDAADGQSATSGRGQRVGRIGAEGVIRRSGQAALRSSLLAEVSARFAAADNAMKRISTIRRNKQMTMIRHAARDCT